VIVCIFLSTDFLSKTNIFMSLLYSASPWTNEESSKKRIPSMKKPSINEVVAANEPSSKQTPLTMEDAAAIQEDRSSRVNDIINKITAISAENDGAHLGDFKPLDPPQLNQRKSPTDNLGKHMDPQQLLPENPLQQKPPVINRPGGNTNYGANDMNLGNLSNYHQSYSAQTMFAKPPQNQPYYAKYGSAGSDDKLMERINYMIHLLEQQQQEKTANVTEEFLLYTFLGVFVIYVVDSFSRTGKYTR
jgi:hypothetical protein